jgi:restriction system protein
LNRWDKGDTVAKRKSSFDDLVEFTAMFPWWVGALLAVGAFVGLHSVAGMEVAAPAGVSGMGDFAIKQMMKTLAFFLQYVIPIGLLLGAGLSAFARKKRVDLHRHAAGAASGDVLNEMSWQEFEMLVSEAFRRKGFAVRETGRNGPDGGVDLVLSLGSDKYLVQCKQWRALKVGVTTIRELYGVMAAQGASGGFVISSGAFTKEAADFARGRNVELVDRKALMELIRDVPSGMPSASQDASSDVDPWANPVAQAEAVSKSLAPACPRCAGAMMQRVAKQGSNAGRPFWGCTSFPRCRGIKPI